MEHPYGRNIQFTRLIKTEGRIREFNFRRAGYHEDIYFSVDVYDDRGNRIIFTMRKENGAWKLEQPLRPLPAWITKIELQLNETIEEEFKVG